MGCVVHQTCSRIVSDGSRVRCGVSARSVFHTLSSRHASDGAQANPASTITTRSAGCRSNTPSISIDVNPPWEDCACPVISSM